MKKVTGGGLPAKAWHEFMVAAHKGLSPAPLFGNGQFIGMQQPVEEQSTIGSIISGVFGGSDDQRSQYPQAPVRRGQQQPVYGGPVPPGDVAEDGGYGYGNALPPGDVGGEQQQAQPRAKRTTLLDLIMGQ
jgi:penicillin-binding protein 1A